MSHLSVLLTQSEPLERHEVADLENWLKVLEGDCETFGEAPEDTRRMTAIKQRLEMEKQRDGTPSANDEKG